MNQTDCQPRTVVETVLSEFLGPLAYTDEPVIHSEKRHATNVAGSIPVRSRSLNDDDDED
jgi:hypothetical protein